MGSKFDDSIPTATTTVSEPRRLHPVEHGIMATGASALCALLIALLIERPWSELWRWLVAGALVPLTVFLASNLLPLIAWTLEGVVRRDITGDGVVGRPHPVLVNPRLGQEVARQQTEAEYRAEFEGFIRGCERSTSLRTWERRGLSRPTYEQFRDTLIGSGYAIWNSTSKEQGWRLLAPAEQIIAEVWRV